jgi:hypothetical protein
LVPAVVKENQHRAYPVLVGYLEKSVKPSLSWKLFLQQWVMQSSLTVEAAGLLPEYWEIDPAEGLRGF